MSEVPGRFDCSINGRNYMIDTALADQFTRRAIPVLRQQVDQSETPGEASLSAEELWRRSQDDWSLGAGQTFLDREGSERRRFRSSKGIDVWERWAMKLLPDTDVRHVSATTTNIGMISAGNYFYLYDGQFVRHTTSLTSWSSVLTGTPAQTAWSIASDGFNVWVSYGPSGIYKTTPGSASATLYNSATSYLLGYVKGRLMAGRGAEIYNIIDGTVPAPLFTHPTTDFTWIGFAEGPTAIYMAGYAGDKSLIYRTTIKPEGTELDVPVVAGELPDGEVVRSIYGYLGFMVLGTDLGVRFCALDGEGNLTIGALIRTNAPVRCLEGQDRFVWFGWSNYDGTSTGLGRMDLSEFTGPLTPAYASDLMVTGQGPVTGVATFADKRVLIVEGLGVYRQTANLVASGTLDTGLIAYGLTDPKTAVYLDVKVREPVDTNKVYLSVDGGAFTLVGTRSSTDDDPFAVGELSGETFEVRHELLNADAAPTTGPVVTRYTLRSYPRPAQGEVLTLPLLLHEQVATRGGIDAAYEPDVEFERLVALRQSKEIVTVELATWTFRMLVDDAAFVFAHPTPDTGAWNGTALVKMKAFAE